MERLTHALTKRARQHEELTLALSLSLSLTLSRCSGSRSSARRWT